MARALLLLVLMPLLAAAHPARAQRLGAMGGDFDFYVLALSWSPSYCETIGLDRGARQCERGANRGFVLHGLWPQYERGYPSNCGQERGLPRYILEEMRGVFPEDGLARHEWRTHGTCSGLGPREFLRAAGEAKSRVRIPPQLVAPEREQRLQLAEIEQAFVAANPGLRPDMIAVTCKRGMIEDIRLCLTKDLRGFRRCEEVNRQQCRAPDVMIPVSR